MKLAITRGQREQTDRKDRLEAVFFQFSCQVTLDQREQGLIERYGQARYPVTFLQMDDIRDYNPKNTDDRVLTISRLSSGWSVESKFVGDLRRTEDAIRNGCAEFGVLLNVMESYGGHEEIEL
jgi:hypothetical protein